MFVKANAFSIVTAFGEKDLLCETSNYDCKELFSFNQFNSSIHISHLHLGLPYNLLYLLFSKGQ